MLHRSKPLKVPNNNDELYKEDSSGVEGGLKNDSVKKVGNRLARKKGYAR